MKIIYLGHAGFCVETTHAIIIMDPWLSEHGAFDAAWFQYPKNQHLQDPIQHILATSPKEKYIYISHEHQDHFDIHFLQSLKTRAFTLLLANFDHAVIKHQLDEIQYQCKAIVLLNHEEAYPFKDGVLRLFIMDTEMNCDSAILVQSESNAFLNINDCKIHDSLHTITTQYGPIDVFAAQFSGASWYPTCYLMSDEHYQATCQKKVFDKFEATARAIETVHPRVYIPSAGPPCFLDPLLIDINFQAVNTYPRAPELISYLNKRLSSISASTSWDDIAPGNIIDVTTATWIKPAEPPIHFESYIRAYAKEKEALFRARDNQNKKINALQVFNDLKQTLEDKIQALKLVNERVKTPLYWRISECPENMYCIDFARKTLEVVSALHDPMNYVRVTTPAWQINKVLTNEISWPDFALTLRVTLERVPDVYDTVVHGFLMLGADKIGSFCEKLAITYHNKERIVVECAGKKYSVLRYCPHQGADLSLAHFENNQLVCPRHQWKFDVQNQGKCIYNESSIKAICLPED